MAALPPKILSLLTKLSSLFMNSLDVDSIFQASFVIIGLKGKQKWSSYPGHELSGFHCWTESGMPWDFSSRCWAPSLSTCHKLSLEQPSQLFKAFHRASLQGPILASLAIPFQHKMEGPIQYLAQVLMESLWALKFSTYSTRLVAPSYTFIGETLIYGGNAIAMTLSL